MGPILTFLFHCPVPVPIYAVVDGYNLPLGVTVVGGRYAPGVPAEYNCRGPLIKPFPPENCPMELRVYSDQVRLTHTHNCCL